MSTETASGESIRKRVASFLQTTLHAVQRRFTSRGAESPKLAVAPSLTNSISAWRNGGLGFFEKRAWLKAEKSNPQGAQAFNEFLQKLSATEIAEENQDFRRHVDTLLQKIGKSPTLIDQGFAIAVNATETCNDGVTRTFSLLQGANVSHNMCTGKYDRHVRAAYKVAGDIFMRECMGSIAEKTVQARLKEHLAQDPEALQDYLEVDAETLAGMSEEQKIEEVLARIDPLEVHMAYQMELQTPCGIRLPAPQMAYAENWADLKPADIEAATAEIKERFEKDFPTWLTKWTPWETVMERVDPKLHAAMLAGRDAAMEALMEKSGSLVDAAIRRMHPDADAGTIALLQNDADARRPVEKRIVDRAIAAVQIRFHAHFIRKHAQ
ncbi:MAG TPA: NEL-type E3 ubiquitin ligase domain-containing protein [Herbaspirillum sp.]